MNSKLGLALLLVPALALSACSGRAKRTTPELSRYNGKKVALIEVDGEATSKSVVEVALVNQILQNGTFILVPKLDVEKARTAHDINPLDHAAIAKRAAADLALRAKVLEFSGETREGYSSVEVEDSQLAAERGKDGAKTQRLYKVKALEGKVRVELEFTDLSPEKDENPVRRAIAESEDRVEVEAKTEAAHLPPKLRFLEKIANEAFRKFFEQYN